MTFVSWAVCYEGESDADYFNQLIPRVMEDIVSQRRTRNVTIPEVPALRLHSRSVHDVAADACRGREAFHLIFIHADFGGRHVAESLDQRSAAYCEEMFKVCQWQPARCIKVAPRHETESWVLADPGAVARVLGYRGLPATLGLPVDARQAERLPDPKAVLDKAITAARKRRGSVEARRLFPLIAREQALSALRTSESFVLFERQLTSALADLGCVATP